MKTSRHAARPRRNVLPRRATYRHGDLREALVAEALRMMTERSDSAFTLREVAQRIQVSHSAVYRHFPSKGALLAEIARRGFLLLSAALREPLAQSGSPGEIVQRQGRAYVRVARTHPAQFRCMFGPRSYSEAEGTEVDAACDEAFSGVSQAAQKLIGVSQETPESRRAALALWSAVHGLAHLLVDEQIADFLPSKTEAGFDALVDQVVAPLIRGLTPTRR